MRLPLPVRFFMLCLLPVSAAIAAAQVSSAAEAKDRQKNFEGPVQAFLKSHCLECHSGDEPEGEFRLDTFKLATEVATTGRKQWAKVIDKISSDEMPPEDSERPEREDIRFMLKWIEQAMADFDCSGPIDPGHETIHRLNKSEYRNTVRDLLGVDFKPADSFPADDVGYGFDNIGDVLSLPPILMEKYLDAAEQIATEAIETDPIEPPVRQRFAAIMLEATADFPKYREYGRMLTTNGEVFTNYDFGDGGQFVLRAKAHGEQAGDENCEMAFTLDGKRIKTFTVREPRRGRKIYEHEVTIPAGTHRFGVAFINDYYDPEAEDEDDRDRNLALDGAEIYGPIGAPRKTFRDSHRRIITAVPSDDVSWDDAAKQVIEDLLERAFRRPATENEVSRFLGLSHAVRDDGNNYPESMAVVLQATLVSPKFLFRVEQDPPAEEEDAIHTLDDFELATRLSYFLWSTMPDAELFELAKRGELRANLDAQITRMLADEKSQALVNNFGGQWLQLRNLEDITVSESTFPQFDDTLRAAMRTESEMFFAAIMREDRSLLEFLDADYTFVNERLARHYGMDGVEGDQFRRVSLEGDRRGGVISQASILTLTSNPTRTAPVKRGKWIMENILGTPPPPPPPNVPELVEDEQAQLSGSLRERLEQHRSDVRCSVCHQKMDTLGFAMENYDAVGTWRDKDGKFDIDASGVLPDGQKFTGPAQLKQILLRDQRDAFTLCISEKMLTYALGRGIEYYDKCTIDRIVASVADNNYKFSSLVLEIVKSDPFQKRRAQ